MTKPIYAPFGILMKIMAATTRDMSDAQMKRYRRSTCVIGQRHHLHAPTEELAWRLRHGLVTRGYGATVIGTRDVYSNCPAIQTVYQNIREGLKHAS